jgi:hypothetical protein
VTHTVDIINRLASRPNHTPFSQLMTCGTSSALVARQEEN